ncbi:dedicator of cytokinesis 9-like [Brachionus plicatilis]|uniref:Dedicator of cytokinesis 9-like n=1 Tax=Brachionus plicatilis TaxID=10195 RepID=A0A3M7Q747_BRAPC|nr:dedicator of cytokinesis 9-like [Brachionus plicatilis]
MYTLGCQVFKKITPNIELEEEINKNNNISKNGDNYQLTDLNQVQYTQSQLLDYLYKSTGMLKLAERYDFMPDIFKLVVAIYESNRDYEQLQQTHLNIQKAYSYLAERDQRSKDKPLATFYRVSFYGKAFEQENNKVYIYKEPGNTKLFEICDRLRKVYSKRFGKKESVEILSDSRKPNELNLDTESKNYIQVTYVQPYFEENDTLESPITYFERNNNLKKFYYEVPYQMKEKDCNNDCIELQPQQHAELLNLCKRKIILETSNWFPYVKKRILVVYEKPIELNPLETAIDEIRLKIEDFESILKKKDITLLELYLQGGIMPQVHKGPLAYAEAFLDPNEFNSKYSKELKKKFKLTFKRLVDSYKKGIDLYFQLSKKITESCADVQLNSKNSAISISNQTNKYLEMYRILSEKFAELENNFRNLLLIDGDFELYQLQLNNSQLARLIMDSTTVSSSQA